MNIFINRGKNKQNEKKRETETAKKKQNKRRNTKANLGRPKVGRGRSPFSEATPFRRSRASNRNRRTPLHLAEARHREFSHQGSSIWAGAGALEGKFSFSSSVFTHFLFPFFIFWFLLFTLPKIINIYLTKIYSTNC